MQDIMDFLGSRPPYDALGAEDLQRLARAVDEVSVPIHHIVVSAGSPPLQWIYVIRGGAVAVLDRGRTVDELGPGDSFGQVSMLSGMAPSLTVTATQDTVLYRLPDPRKILAHPERLRFENVGTSATRERLTRPGLLDDGRGPVNRFARQLVECLPDTSIARAARQITDAGASCAIVTARQGFGIVTDSDFRRGLATGTVFGNDHVVKLASFPAIAVPEDTKVTSAFLTMLQRGVHHLVLTGRDGRPVGTVRMVDLTAGEVRDPLLVREAIRSASTVAELAHACRMIPSTAVELFDTGVPGRQIGGLVAAVIEAVLAQLLAFRAAELGQGGQTSFLVLGSLARGEPLPLSDVDTALVWSDGADSRIADARAAESKTAESKTAESKTVAEQLREVAERIILDLEECGFRRCVDGANASNPLFSRSVSDWTQAAPQWISRPSGDRALLLTSMIADSRPLTNLGLGRRVLESMLQAARSREFLEGLLRFTVSARPPTGLVKDFVLEHSGAHKGTVDLKRGGLLPIASLGRWAAVITGDSRGSTADRLRRGEAAGVFTTSEVDALIGAFDEVYTLLLHREIESIRLGRPSFDHHVDPKTLDPLTRRYLRDAFRTVSEVQARLQSDGVRRLVGSSGALRPAGEGVSDHAP